MFIGAFQVSSSNFPQYVLRIGFTYRTDSRTHVDATAPLSQGTNCNHLIDEIIVHFGKNAFDEIIERSEFRVTFSWQERAAKTRGFQIKI